MRLASSGLSRFVSRRVIELTESFRVVDDNDQPLAYVYFEDQRGRRREAAGLFGHCLSPRNAISNPCLNWRFQQSARQRNRLYGCPNLFFREQSLTDTFQIMEIVRAMCPAET